MSTGGGSPRRCASASACCNHARACSRVCRCPSARRGNAAVRSTSGGELGSLKSSRIAASTSTAGAPGQSRARCAHGTSAWVSSARWLTRCSRLSAWRSWSRHIVHGRPPASAHTVGAGPASAGASHSDSATISDTRRC